LYEKTDFVKKVINMKKLVYSILVILALSSPVIATDCSSVVSLAQVLGVLGYWIDDSALSDCYGPLGLWWQNSVGIHYDGGSVGIGTAAPCVGDSECKLEVDGNIKITSGHDVCIEGGNCLSTSSGTSSSGSGVALTPLDAPGECNIGSEGSMFYSSVLKEPCFCDGQFWKQLDSGELCQAVTVYTWSDNIEVVDDFNTYGSTLMDSEGNFHLIFGYYIGSPYNYYYKKFDKDGNILISDTLLLSSYNINNVKSTIDSSDNIHIVWAERPDVSTSRYISYKKIDKNGNIIIDNTVILGEAGITYSPSTMAIDSTDNIYLFWAASSDYYYNKFHIDSDTIVTTVDRESLISGLSYSLALIDYLDNVHLLGANNIVGSRYKKLSGSGTILVEDMSLTPGYNRAKGHMAIDSDNNPNVVWFDASNDLMNYKKIDNNGFFLVDDTLISEPRSIVGALITTDYFNNVHVVFSDLDGLFYRRLDSNGDTLVENQLISPYISYDITPMDFLIDSADNLYVILVINGKIYIKKGVAS